MSDDDTSKEKTQPAINNPGSKHATDSTKVPGKKVSDKKVPAKKTSTASKSKDHAKSGQGKSPNLDSGHESNKKSVKDQASLKASYLMSGILLVAITISMAGIFMLWQQQQRQQDKERENQQQIQAQSKLISTLKSEIKKIDQSQNQLRNEINSDVATEINKIERSIADIQELDSKNYRDWVLSESEYLLRIANHRLQLEGDIKTAIKGLRIVDSKIKGLADPSLLPVRKHLADEISALESTRLPDIRGMVLMLDSLQSMSPQMKLKISILPKVAKKITSIDDAEEITIKEWELLLGKIWNELKNLVVIKRHDRSLAPVLTVEQQQTIRHILQLKIQGIRTALLNKQPELFLESLKDALNWLQEHFDKDDANVALLKSRLQEFQTVKLNVKLPDIAGSLRALRSIQMQIKDGVKPAVPSKKPDDTNNVSTETDEQVKR